MLLVHGDSAHRARDFTELKNPVEMAETVEAERPLITLLREVKEANQLRDETLGVLLAKLDDPSLPRDAKAAIRQVLAEKASPQLLVPAVAVDAEVEALELSRRTLNPAILRSRLVRINEPALSSHERLTLTLFDDETLTVLVTSKRKASGVSKNEIWQGQIEGGEGGAVTLVVGDNVMVGNVRRPGKPLVQIGYVSGNVHSLREIDESKVLPCGTLVVPDWNK